MSGPIALRVVLSRAALLLALGVALGLAVGVARPGGLVLAHAGAPSSCEAPEVEPSLVAAQQAAQICASERALIADARPASAFAAGHIAGAVHLPCDASGSVAGPALAHLADRSLVLVYGASTEEALAVARGIARRLPAAGAPRVYALEGGFAAWERAGLACASGPCEGCGADRSTSGPR